MTLRPAARFLATLGYASDYVHRFARRGRYLTSFGGKAPPYSFSTLHKLAIDTRFDPPRIIATDRANNRVVHLSLAGDFLGAVAKDLLLPPASWRPGLVLSPHGVAVNARGDLFVSEFNLFGRVHRFDRR